MTAGAVIAGAGVYILDAGADGEALVGVGVIALAAGVWIWRLRNWSPLLDAASAHRQAGRLSQAERTLDSLPPQAVAQHRRAIAVERARIALARDDAAAAVAHATRAIELRRAFFFRTLDDAVRVLAHALRAGAAAANGHSALALEDIRTVRAWELAAPSLLAQVAVAEATVHSRNGDQAALAALLHSERTLLLEYTGPRERALIRSLQRALEATRVATYRDGGKPTVDRAHRAGEPVGAPRRSSLSASRDVGGFWERHTKPAASDWRRAALALCALGIASLMAWLTFSAPAHIGTACAVGVLVLFGVTLMLFVDRSRRATRANARLFVEALRLMAASDPAPAETMLDGVIRSDVASDAATAHLLLSRLASRRADFQRALTHAEDGLGRSAAAKVLVASLLPQLFAERAFLLAVLGREDDARAEVARLGRDYSSSPLFHIARRRVKLILSLRAGDFEGAHQLFQHLSPEAPLSRQEELVREILVATAGAPNGGEAIGLLRSELRNDPELHAWLERACPRAVEALLDGAEAARAV
jgi:hypothetical protein